MRSSYTMSVHRAGRWLQDSSRKAVRTMNDDLMIDDGCGWAVAGVLTELEGAVLTTSVGDGGLAGTMELAGPSHRRATTRTSATTKESWDEQETGFHPEPAKPRQASGKRNDRQRVGSRTPRRRKHERRRGHGRQAGAPFGQERQRPQQGRAPEAHAEERRPPHAA